MSSVDSRAFDFFSNMYEAYARIETVLGRAELYFVIVQITLFLIGLETEFYLIDRIWSSRLFDDVIIPFRSLIAFFHVYSVHSKNVRKNPNCSTNSNCLTYFKGILSILQSDI